MRTLAFDGRMGAAGDMLLGALLSAGADRAVLEPVETALDVEYRVGRVTRNGISATSVDVVRAGVDPPQGRENGAEHDQGSDAEGTDDHDGHDHSDHDGQDHAPDLDNGQDNDHSHTHAEGHGPHRTYAECVDIVEGMDLRPTVEADATAVFRLLGEAEARVHGTDLEDTTFHEVGADDAIADVVGTALLLEDLDVDRVVTTPVAAGGGTVSMSHGVYPVPTPAVAFLAEAADWALRGGPVDRELLTPTGAALLAHAADGVDSLPEMTVEASGYGAGRMAVEDHSNVLRATVGEASGSLDRDEIRVLETNLDDATPEVLGSLQDRLLEAGARDVTVLPATMKKSRPGHLVTVVTKPADVQAVARRLAEETGTLGVRESAASHRWIADRRIVTTTLDVDDERYDVGVKLASDDAGVVYDVSAEFDDARAVADDADRSVREVIRRAETAARQGGALDDHIVHVVERDRWESAGDVYRSDSLEAAGSVHCSSVEAVLAVAADHHQDAEDPVLLVIDPEALDAAVRYEEMADRAYPHVYGPIQRRAVVDVLAFPRADGRYRLPEALRD
jgi:uncharacterized protein (TIGR00299 family) protein